MTVAHGRPTRYDAGMFRLLALLQLTRAALAFTAVADAWTVLLLWHEKLQPQRDEYWTLVIKMVITGVVSVGLYGFGMSLNDLLDARHDRVFAPRRPIPSGRIHIRTAVTVCLLLVLASLLAAAMLMPFSHDQVPWSFLFAVATAFLIVIYDGTSKYLGGFGLVTLGAIRALHCLIGNPRTPLLFLSMFLLTHVIIVSTVAYVLENKRPRLKRGDYLFIVFGILLGNGAAIGWMIGKGVFRARNSDVWIMLIGPCIAVLVYMFWASLILRSGKLSRRQKGERIMVLGLFWLFVYDATMLMSNDQWLAALAVILMFICAVISYFSLRYLGRVIGQSRLEYRAANATLPEAGENPSASQPAS